jgi:hypothetical protein
VYRPFGCNKTRRQIGAGKQFDLLKVDELEQLAPRSALVVEPGIRGDTLLAVMMATLADRPPLVRFNAVRTTPEAADAWARRQLADGRKPAIWRATL